jgi:hypothetical protein
VTVVETVEISSIFLVCVYLTVFFFKLYRPKNQVGIDPANFEVHLLFSLSFGAFTCMH